MDCVVDMKDLERQANLVPSWSLLLVVEGAEFDHLWMLAHRTGRLWSCWRFWVCCNVDGVMHFVGFVCSIDRTNGTNCWGPPRPYFLMEGAEFDTISPQACRAGRLRSC